MKRTKDEWRIISRKRQIALKKIADALGREHPISVMMGSCAWGRNNHEPGTDTTKDAIVIEASALQGTYDVLNTWARDNDPGAQRTMIAIWRETY